VACPTYLWGLYGTPGGDAMFFPSFFPGIGSGTISLAVNGSGKVGRSRGSQPLEAGFFVGRACGMARLLLRLSGFGGQGGASLSNPWMSRFGFMLGGRLGLRQGCGDELGFAFWTAGDVEAGEPQYFLGGGFPGVFVFHGPLRSRNFYTIVALCFW